jgi:hypothetical protein
MGANSFVSAPCIMATSIVCALLCCQIKGGNKVDMTLFSVCMLNQGYFMSHALFRGGKDLPSELRLIVLCVGLCALLANAKAAGLLG